MCTHGTLCSEVPPTELKLGFGGGFLKPPTSGNNPRIGPDFDLVDSIGFCYFRSFLVLGLSFSFGEHCRSHPQRAA